MSLALPALLSPRRCCRRCWWQLCSWVLLFLVLVLNVCGVTWCSLFFSFFMPPVVAGGASRSGGYSGAGVRVAGDDG